MNKSKAIKWACSHFEELTPDLLHQILKLRQEVFIMEQNCIYPDIDEYDCLSLHLTVSKEQNELVGYCRLLPAGLLYTEASIGRVVISKSFRKRGIGRELMIQAHKFCFYHFQTQSVRLNAQHYLERFYQRLGYYSVSEPYDEDGVMHIQMFKES